MEADKFVVVLPSGAIRVVSESHALRDHLTSCGHLLRNTLATTGLLLGRPADPQGLGTPLWVLYESGSVVLRRSSKEMDAFLAADYHLRSFDAALAAPERLALHGRVLLRDDGRVWLTDPYVMYTLPGLDRQFRRMGVTILPTTVVSVDVTNAEVHLPDVTGPIGLPSGTFPIERLLYRTIPDTDIAATRHLRLARSIVRGASTDVARVLEQIDTFVKSHGELLALEPAESIEHAIRSLAERG